MNKVDKARTKQSPTIIENYITPECFVNYFLVVMFAVFPFFYSTDKQYGNIRHDKYYFFLIAALILVLLIFFSVIFLEANAKNKKVTYFDNFNILENSTDVFFILFFIINVVSTFFSGDIGEAITGSQSRNNGLLLIFAYTIVYFLVSRFYKHKTYIAVIFVAAASLVCGLAILNFFYVDPLGIFNNYSESIQLRFTSTIGNINLMSSFACLALAVAFMLYITSKDSQLRIFYLVGVAFSFEGLLVSDSDSGYIGLAAFCVFAFLYCVRSFSRLKDFFTACAVMLLSAKILHWVSLMYEKNKGIDSFANLLVTSNLTYVMLIAAVVIVVIMGLLSSYNPSLKDKKFPKFVFWIFVALLILAVFSLAGLIFYYTFIDTTTVLGDFRKFFRFNEHWGTHRGFMWIKTAEIINSYDLSTFDGIKNLLVGYGPDMYRIAFEPYSSEMLQKYNETTNCAHNEYINFIVTNGIIGAMAYIGIIVSVIIRAAKKAKENPIAIVFVSAVVCYSAQAVVNISQPITTPIFILFIALSCGVLRSNEQS